MREVSLPFVRLMKKLAEMVERLLTPAAQLPSSATLSRHAFDAGTRLKLRVGTTLRHVPLHAADRIDYRPATNRAADAQTGRARLIEGHPDKPFVKIPYFLVLASTAYSATI